jgi:Ca2+-binding EF-hand superfamily protein
MLSILIFFLFGEIDINGDGTISFEEFCKMMKNIIKS